MNDLGVVLNRRVVNGDSLRVLLRKSHRSSFSLKIAPTFFFFENRTVLFLVLLLRMRLDFDSEELAEFNGFFALGFVLFGYEDYFLHCCEEFDYLGIL
ncbi:hypothetical protein TNIN_353181 [Trichonephila inaurata madagascariensis]|uniref:Uncharacterized protein n=1 Tax=Trichonephila inaurata madagascariensis TaxID=2747483 RepID=A0A8X6I6P4_9ARAC|nr:hypothetical protein TNIN_353181 [Trichonephila inaurata madagascariensis]